MVIPELLIRSMSTKKEMVEEMRNAAGKIGAAPATREPAPTSKIPVPKENPERHQAKQDARKATTTKASKSTIVEIQGPKMATSNALKQPIPALFLMSLRAAFNVVRVRPPVAFVFWRGALLSARFSSL